MTIIALTQGSSAAISVTAGQYVEVNNSATSRARIEHSTQGIVNSNHAGRLRYGPFNAGTVTVAAIVGDLTYDNGSVTDTTPLTPVEILLSGNVSPSPFCRMFVPMLQQVGSGAARDYSGNANDVALGSGAVDDATGSGVWSDVSRELNAYMRVQADAVANTKHMFVPNLAAPWDLSEWMIWHMVIRPTAGSTARAIVRCGQTGVTAGWSIQDDGTGKVRVILFNAAGATAVGDRTSTRTLLVTAQTVQLTLCIDPPTGNIHLYANGHLENTFSAAYTGTGVSTRLITFGSSAAASSGTSQAAGTYGALIGPVHYYKGSGSLPSRHASLARRLADMPNVPLSQFELPA